MQMVDVDIQAFTLGVLIKNFEAKIQGYYLEDTEFFYHDGLFMFSYFVLLALFYNFRENCYLLVFY